MTLSISGSQTIAPERQPHWYAQPGTGEQHAFRGIRTVCRRFPWQASWLIVGELDHVDRSKACGECLVATGSTDSEQRLLDGDR